jgi:hypothetical protein
MGAARYLPLCAMLTAALAPGLIAQIRPPIVGVAHIALKTNDLAAARRFYGNDLGFAEPFARGAGLAIFKVNDRQYIELSADLRDDVEDRLANIAFETNAKQLRDCLASVVSNK